MSTYRTSMLRDSISALLVITSIAGVAAGQPVNRAKGEKTEIRFVAYDGALVGNNVYVRSGPSENYYPVTKLQAGQQVRVIGAEGDWLAILPTDGCFSLIAASYVDPGADSLGVVNGDNVRVRAGSSLNDKKYAVQTQLSRGAEVRILGKTDDEFYRIQPPDDVKLWIAAEFVKRAADVALRSEETDAAPGVPPIDEPSTPVDDDGMTAGGEDADVLDAPAGADLAPGEKAASTRAALSPAAERKSSTPTRIPAAPTATVPPATEAASNARIEALRNSIKTIDEDMNAELQKPLLQRDMQRIVALYTPIAEQQDDEYSRMYAETRIAQLEQMIEMNEAVKKVRMVGEQVTTDRQAALVARSNIRPAAPLIHEGFDIEGELRKSAVFTAPTQPKRYRLIDHKSEKTRTIGYVELPADSQIVIDEMLGQIVGIRAREIRYEIGDVNPIAIYVAAEIVPINPVGDVRPNEDASGASIDLIAGSEPLLVEPR